MIKILYAFLQTIFTELFSVQLSLSLEMKFRLPPSLRTKFRIHPGTESNFSYTLFSGGFIIASDSVLSCIINTTNGRTMAQAVSRRLPTAVDRPPSQVRLCGICGGQSGIGEIFLLVLRFLLPILIQCTTPHSSSSVIRGWYNRPVSGRRIKWTQSHPTPRNAIN
jgi:hypothetical protein